jgi:subtilisin-like proprotein convertase family protein
MVNTIIKYNNQTIPFPTPYVFLERENTYYNQYWGNSDTITLNGQITGTNNCYPFSSITSGQTGLLGIFNQNFGTFEILEIPATSNNIFTFTGKNGAGQIVGVIIQDNNTGVPFPLEFDVNLDFYPTDVKLNLIKLSHSYYTDIKMALVSPNNSGVFIPFNIPSGFSPQYDISNYDLIFSKDSTQIFYGFQSGTFKTATNVLDLNIGTNPFPINLPSNRSLSMDIFTNQNPNGKWKLYVFDAVGGDAGSITQAKLIFSNEKIYENSGIIVRSINFNESNYAGLIDYTIELSSTRVSGNVISPTNEYNFTENEDKTISLSHTISAKGINTSLNPSKSNAINNAISFVRSNTGLANVPTTKFISGASNKFYLQSFSESIDRLNNTYSVQEDYTSNLLNTNSSGNLTYTFDITSGADSNIIEMNLRGQYKGPKNGNINDLRNSLNVTGLLSGIYSGYYNPIPIQYSVTENTGENSINFDYSFDNLNLPNPYFKYESNISRDEIQQVYNIQVKGDILARGNRAYRYFLSTGNLSNLTGQLLSVASSILTGFKDFNNDVVPSNLRLLNVSIDQNPNNGTVSANASYDDRFMPTGNFVDANYNVSVEAPRWYMNNQPTCNIKGYHIINDFDITTLPKLNINTTFKAKDIIGTSTESGLRQLAATLTNNLVPTNYNYNTQLNAVESYNKKYNNMTSLSEISYKLDKIDISNQNSLLPKFNAIT